MITNQAYTFIIFVIVVPLTIESSINFLEYLGKRLTRKILLHI